LPRGQELLDNENALYFIINWLNQNRRELEEQGIQILQGNSEKVYFTGGQQLELKVKEKDDWFDVFATVRFGEFNIPFIRLKKYILNDIREFELPNGEIAVLPEEWFARLKGLFPFAHFHGNQINVEKFHFPLLNNKVLGADTSVLEKIAQLETPDKTSVVLPQNLKAQLRSYQEEGFRWMFHLYKNGFGGCLADDMGLGKTLQTLTLLLKLKRLKKEIKIKNPLAASGQLELFATEAEPEEVQPASLIVVPTSLVHNWENEIRKFTPSLKMYKHVGAQRKKAVEMEKMAQYYDVVITTYGTVRNDSEMLSATGFFYLILDESQYIKNPASKTYKAIMQLKARYRLVLTGTPVENSLSDLWSQMNFLNKGVLGNLAFFQRYFITPIEKHGDKEQQEKLQLMIRPFVLRRKKEEVAKDLPPLMEQVHICEMTPEQKKKYELEKSVVRNAILDNIEKEGVSRSSFVILQGLTKLRQLANHPSLLEKTAEGGSGKFDEIFRMLENLMAENHKVLIFSSFVKHLELLREKIEQENWKYSLLTGQTSQREKVIRQFQDDPENRIFLISLKAGGVGLNLTQAGYVFIIDPWWNPASENQAVSRAHRIGQDKHVFVYRFITENSIEEKIQLLQQRKSSLADKFINSNNPFQEITKEEVLDLLK
jgi:SNF2 family DNA or RNA helicase